MDKDDIEMIFRCLMQICRHFAKKYKLRIKAYEPES